MNNDPKKDRNNSLLATIKREWSILLLILATLLAALGYPLRVDFWVKFSIALLFLLLGNYMGKIKHNYFVGIKTPWTLASEEVWQKTHRFAAPLWVAGATVALLLSFSRALWANYLYLGIIIVVGLVPVIYSYLIYRNLSPKT